VKPANVVVTGSGAMTRARLIDLGLAEVVEAPVPRGGTPRYLAPEVLTSPGAGDAAARDLWALGVTLLEVASETAAGAERPWEHLDEVGDPELRALIGALLAPAPGVRASPGWAARRGAARMPEPDGVDALAARRVAAVRRAYLTVRRAELAAAAHAAEVSVEVAGAPGEWLRSAVTREQRLGTLRGTRRSDGVVLRELDAFGRARWLVGVVGATAAGWPIPRSPTRGLAAQLGALAERGPLEAITLRSLTTGTGELDPIDGDPVTLALEIAGGRPSAAVLDRAEALVYAGAGPPPLGSALGRALRLRGEFGRALAVFSRLGTPAAALDAAETARRARDLAGCRAWLARVVPGDDRALAARHAAIAARAALDAGDPARALAELATAPESAATLEVQALATATLGDRERARRLVERAWPLAHDHEDRARVAGVRATLEHADGALEAALGSFRQAAAHAVEAGAVLEEATYLTGLAAAAARFGHLGEALDAARRATLLFEHLGRPAEAARSALTRAAVYAQLGAREETEEAARDAIDRARASSDRRCQAYAHLALADARPVDDLVALEHALRARALLGDEDDEAALRVAARVLRHGGDVSRDAGDATALLRAETAGDARLDWWGAPRRRAPARP
jgi:tetratricopeptide (TPR) repeat protein